MHPAAQLHNHSIQARSIAACLLVLLLAGCTRTPQSLDADVIVAGAGLAGLSAALEASAGGARVLLIDTNSVGGGHAVKAGGMALVDTALQRRKGIVDTPDLAIYDLLRWGEDADSYWTSRYANESGPEVYDWLTERGVEFAMVLDTPEDSVPRFHFTRGTAVNVVVPLLRNALYDLRIEMLWNTRVVALARTRGRISGVFVRDERDGSTRRLRSRTVILATGGFENDLDMVRNNWMPGREKPARLLSGAGHFATGDGYRLAEWAGADIRHPERQEIFETGIPDPRDPAGRRGLHAQNPAAIWINAAGRRFVNEATDSKSAATAIRGLQPAGYWMLFDAEGAKRLSIRDTSWLDPQQSRDEVLASADITAVADTLEGLARKTGLPAHGLRTTVETWNRMFEVGEDFRFGRFGPGNRPRGLRPVRVAPFYAIRVYPLTRKSMGGPAINFRGQVIDNRGKAVAGLYAAGELTGVVGINGKFGGSGTFLGPAVLTGRIAGRSAAAESLQDGPAPAYTAIRTPGSATPPPAANLPGYWHYDRVHALVRERNQPCGDCHADTEVSNSTNYRELQLARLDSCTNCH